MNWLESQLQANVKYEPKLQQQVPKEELERIKMEQIIQNLRPQYIDTKILGDTLTWMYFNLEKK